MKNKVCTAAVAFLLLLSLMTSAFAAAIPAVRFPDRRGTITDDTNALNEATIRDVVELQTLAASRAGVNVHVALVHFLDGVDVQSYASTLFERWNLGGNDMLLLGAIGEDSFAIVSGEDIRKQLGEQGLQNMLYTSGFGELFKNQQYDEAFQKYLMAFADVLNKQYSAGISMDGLLKPPVSPKSSAANHPVVGSISYGSQVWNHVTESISHNVRNYSERRERGRSEMSPFSWIVLAFLLMIVFGSGKSSRRARRVMGCGCSPLGWIFGLLGLGSFLGKRRKW